MSDQEESPKLRRDFLRTLVSMAFLAAGVDKVQAQPRASTNSTQCGKVLAVPPAEAFCELIDSMCGMSSPEGGPVSADEVCGTASSIEGSPSDNDCNKLATSEGDKHEDNDCGQFNGTFYGPHGDKDCTTTGTDNQCGMGHPLGTSYEDQDCLAGMGSDLNCGVGGWNSSYGAQDNDCGGTNLDSDCGVLSSSGWGHQDSDCYTTDNACGMATPIAVLVDQDCGTNSVSTDKDCRRTFHGDQDCQYSGSDQTCTQGKDTLSPPIDPNGPNPPQPPWY